MSLDYAILGFLNYHPSSGYDLKRVFDSSVRHFWPADQGQIYRTLARLTEKGWVEMERVEQEDRPDRKVYQITEAGRAGLIGWLSGPPLYREPRNEVLIQVFFSGQLSDEAVLARFEEHAAQLRAVLARYSDVPGELEPFQQEIDSPRERFFWLLTLENGIASMHANLAWAESVIERIRGGQLPPR
jgi:DNA-binding PadR family transcriptional regulator